MVFDVPAVYPSEKLKNKNGFIACNAALFVFVIVPFGCGVLPKTKFSYGISDGIHP